MYKTLAVIFMLLASCYCLENNSSDLFEDGRAKKKKSPARLLVMLVLLALSKVAIVKVASFFIFLTFFQKLFSFAGVMIKYYLDKVAKMPQPVYGAPQEYNTVGYSYGPPEHEAMTLSDQDNLPFPDIGINWLFNKNA